MTTQRKPLRQRSSTFDLLKGTHYGSKRIAGVYRGPGAQRVLTFVGGGQKTVHRSDLHELAKMEGALQYRTRYDQASRNEKRRMLARSRARNAAIKRGHLARAMRELVHLPEPERAQAIALLVRAERTQFGSIHVGDMPASSLLTPHPRRAYQTASLAGGRWITTRRHGKTHRILVRQKEG